jgi:hypothetical protein
MEGLQMADRHGRGRPKFEPTEEKAGSVRALLWAGYTQGDIASFLGISEKTLRKNFRNVLDNAEMDLFSRAAGTLAMMALGSPVKVDPATQKVIRAEIKPDLGALCFLLKTRGKKLGWSERHELVGKDGTPLGAPPDLSVLTDDELAAYIALNKKLAAGTGGKAGGAGA